MHEPRSQYFGLSGLSHVGCMRPYCDGRGKGRLLTGVPRAARQGPIPKRWRANYLNAPSQGRPMSAHKYGRCPTGLGGSPGFPGALANEVVEPVDEQRGHHPHGKDDEQSHQLHD